MPAAKLANRLWLWSQSATAKAFHKSRFNVEEIQHHKLLQYMRINSHTRFGKQFGFDLIRSYNDFQKNIPVHEWNDLVPWVEAIKNGEQNVLTKEPVQLFEETSGTTSFSKLIPYTAALKKEIQNGVAVWMHGLHQKYPGTFNGPSYWSVSPPLKERCMTPGGLPVGIEDDKDYFNPVTRYLLDKIMAVPSTIRSEKNTHAFYFKTFEHLLLKEDLSFISVWSPTFFLQLDEFLSGNRDELLKSLVRKTKSGNARIRFLEKILSDSYTWKMIWPKLTVVSCWTDAQSGSWTSQVQQRAGKVFVQGKGLLSTEGISSIPVIDQQSPLLSIHSHFYEFREPDSGAICRAHEVREGKQYEIIFTTAGGLYRYASGDIVAVDGFYGQIPSFRFRGRKNSQSDLVGEKLAEIHVSDALKNISSKVRTQASLVFVYPSDDGPLPLHYRLYVESLPGHEQDIQNMLPSLAREVEYALCENPYYKTALELRQLAPMEGHLLSVGFRERYRKHLNTQFALKDGDIKFPVLVQQGKLTDLLDV